MYALNILCVFFSLLLGKCIFKSHTSIRKSSFLTGVVIKYELKESSNKNMEKISNIFLILIHLKHISSIICKTFIFCISKKNGDQGFRIINC